MPPISNRVIGWHTIKTYLFVRLCQHLRKQIHKQTSVKKLAVLLALFGGTFIYKIITAIIDKFFCWLLNMKELSTMDEFFLYDDDKSLSNTCIVAKLTTFEYESMSEHYKKKFGEADAFRVRLYDLFGK